MKKAANKIPKFKNYEQEAKFWDSHSLADYWKTFKHVNLVVDLNKPKEETMVLRIQKSLKNKLQRVAKKKGVNSSSLARMWIAEKLQTL